MFVLRRSAFFTVNPLSMALRFDRVFDWLLSEALQPHYLYPPTCILSLNSFLAMVLYPMTIGIETSIYTEALGHLHGAFMQYSCLYACSGQL